LIEASSLLFSVFAFVFTTIIMWKSTGYDKRIKKLELKEREEKENEKKKALIEARVFQLEKCWTINVYNRGLATARNIRFISSEMSDDNKSGIHICIAKGQIPYPLLHTGGSFDITAFTEETHKPITIVKFIWDDDYANNNERELALNF
jgi:hypothetical protein